MATVDEMKMERDGHLSYGRVHPSDPSTWMWPVVTAIGYDAEGQRVSHCVQYAPEGGVVEYGEHAWSYEATEAGKVLGYWK